MNHEQIAKNLSDGIDAGEGGQVNDDYHQMAAECGVPISSERVMHVVEYIKQLEADRDTLAAEVIKWRQLSSCEPGDEIDVAAQRTDASGALTRAK
jgi:hypothetical protein